MVFLPIELIEVSPLTSLNELQWFQEFQYQRDIILKEPKNYLNDGFVDVP